MYLQGELNGKKLENVTTIPDEAIVGQNAIYVLSDSSIVKKDIDVVLRSDRLVYTRGIDQDDKVIIKGLNSLSPGQRAIAIKE